jgi:hypothetical protein
MGNRERPRTPGPTQHVRRAAGLAVAVITVLLGLRAVAQPDSYGAHGPYRGDALVENAALPERVTSPRTCGTCHTAVAETMAGGAHARVHCSHCHDLLRGHTVAQAARKLGWRLPLPAPDAITAGWESRLCASCHRPMVGRSPRVALNLREHLIKEGAENPSSPKVCSECHGPHDPSG